MGVFILVQIMFFAILALMIIIVNPVRLLKMHNADIIEIRDIEMSVTNKNKHRSDNGGYSYHIGLVCVENKEKKTFLNSREAYIKHDIGDIIIMQEVIYKKDEEIFSVIKYATNKDYERNNSYKSQNQLENETSNLDFATELKITEYHMSQNKLNNLIVIVSIVVFIAIFIAMMSQMNNLNIY